jgi:cytochrome d ubiquinol oxidase subunit II
VVDIHTLRILWFVLIAALWVGYFVLEGFDFGVGMLLPVLGRNDAERRALLTTIGPVWDGNEVWLITAGGATFAAFPLWYSTLFSAFYLPLLLILVALILRGVAFEYRGTIDDERWRARWDLAIVTGSAVPALLWGVAFGAVVRGLDVTHVEAGPFAVLGHALTPYPLATGLVTMSLSVLHGCLFIGLKTAGDLRRRAVRLAGSLSVPTAAAVGAWALATRLLYGTGWTSVLVVAAVGALAGVVAAARAGREGLGFTLTSVTTALAVVLIFGSLYPAVLPMTGGRSLTIDNASSSRHTLAVMTWVAAVAMPVVLAYTSWTYWVFRRRVGGAPAPAVRPHPTGSGPV